MKHQHWIRKIFPTSRRLLVEQDLKMFHLTKLGRTLVVGAGYDPYHNIINSELYVRLDIKNYSGFTDIVGDGIQLPFRPNSFDTVLAVEVMEHVALPGLFVEQIYNVLIQGGRAVVTVPFMFHQHGDPQDFWRPTRQALDLFFSQFKIVIIQAQGNRLCVISDLLTTAFSPYPLLFPLRIFNHLLVRICSVFSAGASSAPSGFLLIGRK